MDKSIKPDLENRVDKDEWEERLAGIDGKEMESFIEDLTYPCYESELLKIAFPGMDILHADPLTLYRNHFLLFHYLFLLQDKYYKKNMYLHIHFMRTYLLAYPERGKCRFYEADPGRFCRVDNPDGELYCDFHRKLVGDTELEAMSVKYFYLDWTNYYGLDAETARLFVDGAWEILSNYDDYRKSFVLLDLPETSSVDDIKRKFKQLAKKYHPDKGAESHEKFVEINRAYRLLMRLIPIMR
jgi:hypothetical protein